ncbi:MAG TPA: PQQ-binding-like beta-propeller repeat protein [bacterium]|nr:PQQ-binding-like beta-propeller repeat protein [bacterium]
MTRRIACALLALAAGFFAVFFSAECQAVYREKPKTHFLSWESKNRPEELRKSRQYRGDVRRLRVSKDRIAKLKKSSFWNKRPYQFSTPAISGDRLYIGADAGRFYAIEVPRGKKLWDFVTEGPVQSKAAVFEETVYFSDTKANVYALDAATGEERWRAKLDTEVLAEPLISGGRVIIADMSGRLYALDRSTGGQIWHTPPADQGIGFSVRRASSPVEGGGLIIVGTQSGGVIAYRSSDGSVAWSKQISDRQTQVNDVDSKPLVIGGRVYVTSAEGTMAAMDISSGDILWIADAGGVNDPILHEGKIYASGGGVISAVDPETGAIFWQQDLETPEISSPAGGERYVAVVTTMDKLFIVDSEKGDILFDRYIRKGSFGDPVTEGDGLYLLSNSGALYGFKIRELPPKKGKAQGKEK